MQSIAQIKSLKNMILTSNNRCPNCKKKYLLKNSEEYCFYCNEIAPEDKRVEEEAKTAIDNREVNELLGSFKQNSLINPKLEKASFENYHPQNESQRIAFSKSLEFANSFTKESQGLWFQGRPGLGKSHLGASIAKLVIEKKYSCIFISLPRLMTEIKNTYRKDSKVSELDLFRGLESVDLLILDDIGAEKIKEDEGLSWSKSKIFEIIDSRIGKPTVFTTNYTGKELIRLYGERDFSRMVENTQAIKMDGDNYRLNDFK